jgi:phage-related protein
LGTELAKAYVQIVPSARGIKGKISEQLGSEGDSAGRMFGANMAGAIKGVIAAAGIGKAISTSINEGAALQQSLGGIETLFKDSADKVKENAAQAFRTAGMSANEYMEMTTSFAASLLSSLGNDTDKAADVADMAMVDMSDNANKMGTSMELIQNAYQGFAKQNYTMLDNLKLGYGGTKTEMERLLADAQKITGIKYDINNLSDVYSAIHVIQGELGITGTTAKEAATTFTGSFMAMKAAAKNLVGNLSLGNDIQQPLLDLQETVHTFFVGNFLPMIGNVIKGIPALIEQGLSMMTLNLNLLAGNADKLVEQGLQLVTSLITGIVNGVPFLIEAAWNVISAFGIALLETDWVEVAQNLITNLRTGVDNAAGQILGTDKNIIGAVLDAITKNLPQVLTKGTEILTNVVNGILSKIPVLISATGMVVNNFINKILQMLPEVLQSGVQMLLNVANGITNNLPKIVSSATQVIADFISTIGQNLPSVLQSGVQMILSVVNGIINNLPQVVSSASQAVSDFINTIGAHLPGILQTGIEILGNLASGIVSAIPDLVAQIPQIVDEVIGVFTNTDWWSVGMNIISGIASGLAGAAGQLWDAVKGVLGGFKDQVLAFFGIHSPSRWGIWVGEMIDQGFAKGIEGNLGPIRKSVNLMEGTVTKPFETGIEYNGRIGRTKNTSDTTVEELLREILALLEMIANKNPVIKIYLKDREVTRSLKELGVVFT